MNKMLNICRRHSQLHSLHCLFNFDWICTHSFTAITDDWWDVHIIWLTKSMWQIYIQTLMTKQPNTMAVSTWAKPRHIQLAEAYLDYIRFINTLNTYVLVGISKYTAVPVLNKACSCSAYYAAHLYKVTKQWNNIFSGRNKFTCGLHCI